MWRADQHFVVAAAIMVLLLGLPAQGRSQGIAESLDELRLLVRPGDTIVVGDRAGSSVRGRILSLSPSTLVVRTDGRLREWSQAELLTISTRRADSLGNGALIGLGIGAGIGVAVVAANCGGDDDCGAAVTLVGLFYGGVGAGIGAGVDALISRHHVIFERQAGSARLGVAAIRPSGGSRGVGAAVAVGF